MQLWELERTATTPISQAPLPPKGILFADSKGTARPKSQLQTLLRSPRWLFTAHRKKRKSKSAKASISPAVRAASNLAPPHFPVPLLPHTPVPPHQPSCPSPSPYPASSTRPRESVLCSCCVPSTWHLPGKQPKPSKYSLMLFKPYSQAASSGGSFLNPLPCLLAHGQGLAPEPPHVTFYSPPGLSQRATSPRNGPCPLHTVGLPGLYTGQGLHDAEVSLISEPGGVTRKLIWGTRIQYWFFVS